MDLKQDDIRNVNLDNNDIDMINSNNNNTNNINNNLSNSQFSLWNSLESELLTLCFWFLDAKSLLLVSRVCSYYRNVIKNPYNWIYNESFSIYIFENDFHNDSSLSILSKPIQSEDDPRNVDSTLILSKTMNNNNNTIILSKISLENPNPSHLSLFRSLSGLIPSFHFYLNSNSSSYIISCLYFIAKYLSSVEHLKIVIEADYFDFYVKDVQALSFCFKKWNNQLISLDLKHIKYNRAKKYYEMIPHSICFEIIEPLFIDSTLQALDLPFWLPINQITQKSFEWKVLKLSSLAGYNISKNTMISNLSTFTSLRSLDCSYFFPSDILLNILPHFKQLSELCLRLLYCNKYLSRIIQACPSTLKILILKGVENRNGTNHRISIRGEEEREEKQKSMRFGFINENVIEAISNLKNLTTLKFYVESHYIHKQINYYHFMSCISASQSSLTHLALPNTLAVNDTLLQFVATLPLLQLLNIQHCKHLDMNIVNSIQFNSDVKVLWPEDINIQLGKQREKKSQIITSNQDQGLSIISNDYNTDSFDLKYINSSFSLYQKWKQFQI